MCREAREEAGLTIQPDQLSLVHVIHRRSDDARMSLFFQASHWLGEPGYMEPYKCSDLSWFDLAALPGNMVLLCAPCDRRTGPVPGPRRVRLGRVPASSPVTRRKLRG